MKKKVGVVVPESRKASDRLSDVCERLSAIQEKIRGWDQFTREMRVLPDVAPALASGRAELMAVIKPRALSKGECEVLFEMLVVLMETNSDLREHAALLSQLAEQHLELVNGVVGKLHQLADFADFRPPIGEE